MIVLTKIERELLLKGSNAGVDCILTHSGFNRDMDIEMSNFELNLLHDLSIRLKETDTTVVIDDVAFGVYITGYNGGYCVAGIKINKVIR